MRARTIWFSRSAAVVTAVALAAACESAAPPAKTAGDAAQGTPPGATTGAAPADTSGAPATDAPATAAIAATPAPAASAPATDGHVFKKKLPAVGVRTAESEIRTLSLTMNAAGKKPGDQGIQVKLSERVTIDKTVEVLAVSADAVTKVKVSYKDHSTVKTKDGVDSPSTALVSGKTYVVEAKGDEINVLTAGGAPAREEEAKVVQKDFKKLGKPDELQSALPDTPLKVGDKADSMAQGLRKLLTKDDDPTSTTTIENASVTFARVSDKGGSKTGIFDIVLDVVTASDKLVIRLKMRGEVEMRMEDGMPVSMSFQAPAGVASAPGAPGPKLSGAGLATFSATRERL